MRVPRILSGYLVYIFGIAGLQGVLGLRDVDNTETAICEIARLPHVLGQMRQSIGPGILGGGKGKQNAKGQA